MGSIALPPQITPLSTAQRTARTPKLGELIWDTDTAALYAGNGSTVGGTLVNITGNAATATSAGSATTATTASNSNSLGGVAAAGYAVLAAANPFTRGQSIAAATSDVGLTIKAAATTPGNILSWQTSAAAALGRIDSAGNIALDQGQGITLFNTADETTNYERCRFLWNSNVLTITTEMGGTGTHRAILISANTATAASSITLQRVVVPFFKVDIGATGSVTGPYFTFTGTTVASSGTPSLLSVATSINQTSTAGFSAFDVNPTIIALGSGTSFLQRWMRTVAGVPTTYAWVEYRGTINAASGFAAAVSATKTTTYQVLNTDCYVPCDATSGAFTATLPAANTCSAGQVFTLIKIDSSGNAVTVSRSGSDTINGTGAWGATSVSLSAQGHTYTLWTDGSSKWYVRSKNIA